MRETILAATLGLIICAPIRAQSVNYDYDRSADFSRYRTFAWTRGTTLNDQLNHNRVVSAVESQLKAHGLTATTTGEADLLVAYHASFDTDVRISAFGTGPGYFRWGGARSAVATAEEIVRGTLMVDLIDARTRTVVWRGIASREIDTGADPDKRDRNINRATEKLFKHYPATR